MKKFGIVLTIFLMLVFCRLAEAASQIKIGYVDLQQALNESQHGKDAKEKFSEELKERQEQIASNEAKLKEMQEELQKKAPILKEEAVKEKEAELKKEAENFQKFFLQSEEEMKRKESQLTRSILQGLEVVVKEIAKEKGYTFIFEKMEGGILYGPDADDLTGEVVKKYNKRYSKEKKK
jgi:outer membrane protein